MNNEYRLEGVEGNVWIRPIGLNSVRVDAHSNSGSADEGYEPDARVRPRYLTYRGKHFTHMDTWQQVGGEWLPLAYLPGGNDVAPVSIDTMSTKRDPGSVDKRGSAKVYDEAPPTYAKAILLSIQKAIAAWYAQPGSIRLLAEAHLADAERAYTAALDKTREAMKAQEAAVAALDEARKNVGYAERLIHEIDLDSVDTTGPTA